MRSCSPEAGSCCSAPTSPVEQAATASSATAAAFPRAPADPAVTVSCSARTQSLELRFSGAPFEQVFLVMSHTAAHVDAPELDGVWLLQGPARTIACGALDAGGALTLDWTTPSLPAGVAGDVLHLQPVMIDALGNTRLGCARVLVRLDANH